MSPWELLDHPPFGREVSLVGLRSYIIYFIAFNRCKAVFVDTDRVPAFDSRVGDLVQNEIEGKLVYQITETLLQCGVSQKQIGIMSLYQQQIKLLSHLLQGKNDIEILTADKSQGRDKDCVVISMVRSNDSGQVCSELFGFPYPRVLIKFAGLDR